MKWVWTPDKASGAASRAAWLMFSVAALFWIVFIAAGSPNLGGTDAFIFRDPGCNCAAGQGLVSDSVPTNGAILPQESFAAYTPGAPLLFAPAARLFGCSSYVDTYYNFFLLLLLSVLILCFYFRFEERPGRRLLAALIVGATLPGGLFLTNLDRPETIGLVVAFSLIYLWRNDRSGLAKVLLLGSTGALFLIHPYIGIVEFLLFVFLLVWSPAAKSKPGVIAGGALLAAAIVAGCAAYMQHLDPTTLHRFLSHALGAGTGAGAVLKGQSANANKGLLHNYAAAGKRYFNAANLLSAVPLLMLLCSLGVIALYLAKKRTENAKKRDALQLGCLFCILFLFPAAVFLPQRNYFAASSALLFAVITSAGYSLSDRMRHTRAPLLLLVVAVFFSLPAFSLRLIATREFKASYLRSSEQAARVKKIFGAQGDPQPRLLIDPTHFFVYKPYFEYLYNYQYLRPEDSTSEFQGLVRCYTGELAFSRSELAWPAPLHKSDWKLIDGDAGVERTTLFGHPIQRRNWSWACDVYERKNAKP